MKNILSLLFVAITSMVTTAQVKVPKLSPYNKVQQVVGLTNVSVEYSRPAMRGREIFGELVPYGEIWRTGANNNTIITFDDDIKFAGTPVKAGSYAIFTKPSIDSWEIMLYSDTENWGVPKTWDDNKVVAKATAKVYTMGQPIEDFTISFSEMKANGANLYFLWEKAYVEVPFEVPTDQKVMKNIEVVLSSSKASSDDYMTAAYYYYQSKKDITQAKTWIDKAVEMKGKDVPFWCLRRQSLIYAKVGKIKKAIKIAKKSLKLAKEAGNRDYVNMNKASIEAWNKK